MQEKKNLQRLIEAQEDERKRIARDLHDELGQQLSVLRIQLESAKKLCEDEEVCDKIDEIQLIAQSIDKGIDFLAWELRPAALDDLGLIAAIGNYLKQWSQHSGIKAELLDSSLKKVRLAPTVETNIYRIVQEALNNIYKHAKAKSVEVILEKRDDLIVLIVADDGKGFNIKDIKNRSKGIGLIGMKERAELMGGTLEIESAAGKGTTIYVRIQASAIREKEAQ
jgi:signal transduction histidine kinase